MTQECGTFSPLRRHLLSARRRRGQRWWVWVLAIGACAVGTAALTAVVGYGVRGAHTVINTTFSCRLRL